MPFVRTRVPEQWAFHGTCYMTRPVLLEPQHLGIVKKNVLERRSHGSDAVRETYPLQLMLENAVLWRGGDVAENPAWRCRGMSSTWKM